MMQLTTTATADAALAAVRAYDSAGASPEASDADLERLFAKVAPAIKRLSRAKAADAREALALLRAADEIDALDVTELRAILRNAAAGLALALGEASPAKIN